MTAKLCTVQWDKFLGYCKVVAAIERWCRNVPTLTVPDIIASSVFWNSIFGNQRSTVPLCQMATCTWQNFPCEKVVAFRQKCHCSSAVENWKPLPHPDSYLSVLLESTSFQIFRDLTKSRIIWISRPFLWITLKRGKFKSSRILSVLWNSVIWLNLSPNIPKDGLDVGYFT